MRLVCGYVLSTLTMMVALGDRIASAVRTIPTIGRARMCVAIATVMVFVAVTARKAVRSWERSREQAQSLPVDAS